MKGAKKMISKSIAIEQTSHSGGAVNAVKVCSRWSLILLLLALAFAVPAWAQVCIPPPLGMVSWWPGDGNANDIIDSNNGTLENGATFAAGKVGQAFSFNGVGDVRVPHNNNQNTGAQISVDAWIFIPNPLGSGFTTASIINKRSPSNNEGYTFELVNGFNGDSRNGFQHVDNGLQFEITTPNGAFVNAITMSNVIASGQWYFVAGTYDGSTIKVFVNGLEVASKSITGSINPVSNDLVIGRNIVNGGSFPGLIDEVELFSRALTQPEILGIFNAGSAGKCKPARSCVAPPSGMVSWWPGDGNANDIVDGNNGTLQGGATFAPGLVGQAFSLDGINAFVDAGNASNLQVSSGDFTVDTWVNFNALSHPPGANSGAPAGDMSIVDKMSAAGVNVDGWRLIKQADNRFWFCLGGRNGNHCGDPAFTVFSATRAAVGLWFHVAAVKTSSGFSIYVNGHLEDTRTPLPAFLDTNSTNLRIGSYVLEGSHLNGLVDEVELFNRALSAAEILSIFNAGSAGKCKPARAAYVANAGSHSVSVINPTTNTVVATVTVGRNPVHVAVTPNEASAYVSNAGANTVSVINSATNSVATTVQVGFDPVHAAATPNGSNVYVTNARSNSVSVISTATNAVVATVPVGANPVHVAITPDGSHAYVTNAGSNNVSVIDTASNTVTTTVPVGRNPVHVAVTPNGASAYVSNAGANTVSVINTATNTVVATVQVGFIPVHAAVTPNGSSVYVTNARSNSVSVISTATNTVATVPVGANPVHVAITPDGSHAYVTNAGSNNVSVIDTASNTVTATVPVGPNPVNVAVF